MAARVPRDNNFDAIRLVAALAVLIGHGWPLNGVPHPPTIGGIPVFTLAVYVFFSLSGYLVGTSWVRDSRPLPFLIRRVSRIFPALIVVVVITTFVIGPLVTTMGVGQYFGSPTTWTYLTNVTLLARYDLPGVFTDHARPVVNGALWTLGPEFLCYLGVLVVGLLAMLARRAVPGRAVAAAFAIIAVVIAALSLPGMGLDEARPALQAMVFFAVGSMLAHAGVIRPPLLPAGILLVGWAAGAVLVPELRLVWAWIALPYVVLAIGARSWPVVRRAGRFGDFSYGTYLWGFPIQQIVVQLLPAAPLAVSVTAAVVATLAIAAASWHLVEKRSLAMGRKLAGTRSTTAIPEPHPAVR
jgi:peptidoglycan/LPS O-acetylase OafA/YrhL